MITQTLSMIASMYDAIGPGFVLVAALPFLLVALAVVARAATRKARVGE